MTIKEKRHDVVPIAGDYQLNALTKGHPLQRAWHHGRIAHLMNHLHFNKTDLVADIGCGSGINISKIAPLVQNIIGIDSNQAALEFCTDFFKNQTHVQFKFGQIDQTEIAENSLNKIICTEVIEHVYENQVTNALLHWNKLLKNDGELYLTTPNYHSFWPILEWCLDHTKMVTQLADEQHVSKWNAEILRLALKQAGFKNIEIGSFNFILPFNYFVANEAAKKTLAKIENRFPNFVGPLLYAKATK